MVLTYDILWNVFFCVYNFVTSVYQICMFHSVLLVLCWTIGGNITSEIEDTRSYALSTYKVIGVDGTIETKLKGSSSSTSLTSRHKNSFREPPVSPLRSSYNLKGKKGASSTVGHQCDHFAFPPPPPADRRRTGPRRKFCFVVFSVWPCFQLLTYKTVSVLNFCNSIWYKYRIQCILSCSHFRILMIRFLLFPFQHVLCAIFLWSKL